MIEPPVARSSSHPDLERPALDSPGRPVEPNDAAALRSPLASGLAPWDLLPSDLVLVRRRSVSQ